MSVITRTCPLLGFLLSIFIAFLPFACVSTLMTSAVWSRKPSPEPCKSCCHVLGLQNCKLNRPLSCIGYQLQVLHNGLRQKWRSGFSESKRSCFSYGNSAWYFSVWGEAEFYLTKKTKSKSKLFAWTIFQKSRRRRFWSSLKNFTLMLYSKFLWLKFMFLIIMAT